MRSGVWPAIAGALAIASGVALGLTIGGQTATGEEAHRYDVRTLTCKQFTALPARDQVGLLAWSDGHDRSHRPAAQLGEVELGRDESALLALCRKAPTARLRDQLKLGLPEGRRRVRAAALTCKEFTGLRAAEQRELAAFASGYYVGQAADDDAVYEADYERDVAQLVGPCRQNPTAPFWARVQDFFASEDE